MTKISHWDVGATKLRDDDIVGSAIDSHTTLFSKMTTSNFPGPNRPISQVLCSAGWISWCQTIGVGVEQSN